MDVDREDATPAVEQEEDIICNEDNISYPATNVVRGMLRELLTLPDYSLTRIAAELEVSSATIRRLLQGDTLQPSVRTFDKVIRLYCSVCHEIYANQDKVE